MLRDAPRGMSGNIDRRPGVGVPAPGRLSHIPYMPLENLGA